MCGRFTLKTPERIRLPNYHSDFPTLKPRYNIAPSQDVLTVVQRGASREATFLQWGLIPSWSKEAKGIINARVETIESKPSFSDSFKTRRCLIFADGFYEWERHGKISQPYYFQMKDGAPFTFAGVWDRWKQNGRTMDTCAIITTTANELLSTIHHRMPVILEAESHDLWLGEDSRAADLKELLAPYPADAMTSYAVSYDVNDAKLDDQRLVLPAEPNIGVTLRLF